MSNSKLKSIKTRIQHKHDVEVNWLQATNFIPLKGELIIYDKETSADVVDDQGKSRLGEGGRTIPYNYERFKIGNGVINAAGEIEGTPIGSLPFATMMKPEYIEYLDAQLYQKPAISAFNMVSGSREVGQSVTVSSFTHYETNVGNINGTLTLKKGSTTIQTGITPKSSSTSVNLTTAQTITASSASTIKYTLSGTDTTGNAFSKENSISFYFPSWYGYSSSASITNVDGLTKVASATLDGTKTVETTEVGYVYFVTTDTISRITSGGFDVTTTNSTLTLDINGVNKTYNVYRTNQLNPGTLSYVIS